MYRSGKLRLWAQALVPDRPAADDSASTAMRADAACGGAHRRERLSEDAVAVDHTDDRGAPEHLRAVRSEEQRNGSNGFDKAKAPVRQTSPTTPAAARGLQRVPLCC